MHRFAPLRRGLGAILMLLATLPAHTFAAPTPVERAQIQATRATSSLMLVRGEGFQQAHLQRLEEDLQALGQAMQALVPDETLRRRHQALVDQLRQGVDFGPGEENMPWRYPEALSQALRDFLTGLRAHPDATPAELAAKIEYLSVQYLSRAYFGNFEIAREQPNATWVRTSAPWCRRSTRKWKPWRVRTQNWATSSRPAGITCVTPSWT